MNNVTIVGNVTREPDLRFTGSGQAVTSFGVAVNRSWKAKGSDEWSESVEFFDVTVWQQLAENVAESVVKGCRVVVTGRLETRSWESKEGDKRSKTEVVADEVGLSLKFASGSIVKNERRGGSESASRPVAVASPAGYDVDSEPF